uniref:ATP synthase F0 subunit 8 n=1 Tax=Scolytinae sp. 6 ACP-2013 TaxID=1434579 RepID=A0A3G3MEB0_9CUCU|nr:ATP synthase F0 subunit 8 [Scolytinae sp. 6 ACP-2013]
MPQMAPLNWKILYIYFSLLIFTLLIFSFYSINPNSFLTYKTIKPLKIFWKW